jgi:hypothetical protein
MADRPDGPFVVDQSVSHPFFNGGTLAFKGRLLHLGSVPDWVAPVLHESADGGRGWERLSARPVPRGPSWRALQSDAYVYRKRPGIAVYFAAREGASGAHIGSARYRNGRWTRFRVALNRVPGTWDGLDLGEPAVFRARGTTWMLYGGLGDHGEPRHIGLARLTPRGWRRCGSEPFVSAGRGWYLSNAIDPEPEVVGDRLYLYFGGGLTPSLGGNMRGTIGLRVYRLPKRR